jgi:hypothetical protein
VKVLVEGSSKQARLGTRCGLLVFELGIPGSWLASRSSRPRGVIPAQQTGLWLIDTLVGHMPSIACSAYCKLMRGA